MYSYVLMDKTIFISHLNMTLGILWYWLSKTCMKTQNTTDIQGNPNQKETVRDLTIIAIKLCYIVLVMTQKQICKSTELGSRSRNKHINMAI